MVHFPVKINRITASSSELTIVISVRVLFVREGKNASRILNHFGNEYRRTIPAFPRGSFHEKACSAMRSTRVRLVAPFLSLRADRTWNYAVVFHHVEEIKRGGWRRDGEKPEKREDEREKRRRRTRRRIAVDDDNVQPWALFRRVDVFLSCARTTICSTQRVNYWQSSRGWR